MKICISTVFALLALTPCASGWCEPEGPYVLDTGFCDKGGGPEPLGAETNTIEGTHGGEWIINTVKSPSPENANFTEIENCARDDTASTDNGPVYDCVSTYRSDDENIRPNVILRYSFNSVCTSFTKLVQVVPGDNNEPGSVPHICKIIANKSSTTKHESIAGATIN